MKSDRLLQSFILSEDYKLKKSEVMAKNSETGTGRRLSFPPYRAEAG